MHKDPDYTGGVTGGGTVTTEVKEDPAPGDESPASEEKSFFARGALVGLFAGAVVAVMLISVGGSVASLLDDLFGSDTQEAAVDEAPVDADPLVAAGRNLTATCIGCHSDNGVDGVGPTWQGLLGSNRLFEDGTSAVADAAYILNSIINPEDQIVAGYAAGQMPANYGETFSSEELDALVAYISSL